MTLCCVPVMFEQVSHVRLSTDGADLPSHVRQTNGVLQFSTVTRADGGNYTCVASSSAQGEIRAHVHLTVGGVCLWSDLTLWLMTSCSTHALTLIHYVFCQFTWSLSWSRSRRQSIRVTRPCFTVRRWATRSRTSSGCSKTNCSAAAAPAGQRSHRTCLSLVT